MRSLAYLQAAIHVTLVTSFLLGTVSAWLRTNKTLALTGIGFTLAAALLGGSRVAGSGDAAGAWLGVDFFVLNLVLYSAVFVPLERLFALRPEQPVFRRQWPVDLTYFFINSLLIEVLTILTLKPAVIFFDWTRVEWVRGAVALLPLPAQVLALLLVADFTQYLGASRLPPLAVALALSRNSPLHRADGLAGGVPAAPGRRDRDARADLRAHFRARILRAGADGVRVPGRDPGHLHPRQRAVDVPGLAADYRHAGVPSLAP